ncbi:nuclear transport factor 2 family protein [Nocardia sp. CDC153]|uniref:nuclear transport factor 2 family protein n=1 Tax=unclassified Nocardia TaxID=2637762 RepID=UPI002DB84ACC|nr:MULTISPECIES: nuclear transport factor 2 family protein [unclassified Nocardia]MEC3917514.1 nuclear transport factor 2 family protein [Nocardia sp. CDC160]MEC3956445.1 nuclear transport factor 2 family protein [Nocardia sp. CDC153]
MLSLQEISDRLEIEDLMVRYSHAVDTHQWELLDEIFTTDAHIDYTAMGGPAGDVESTKKFLATVMPNFSAFQHLIANSSIRVEGDHATARTMCHNPMLVTSGDGTRQLMLCGLWYHDTFLRVNGEWRIQQRIEEKSYMFVAPDAVPKS